MIKRDMNGKFIQGSHPSTEFRKGSRKEKIYMTIRGVRGKPCKKCGNWNPLDSFVKNSVCKDGRADTCRKCSNIYGKEWKCKHKDRISARRRELYEKNIGWASRERIVQRMEERRKLYPLRVRCQMLRGGMILRSHSYRRNRPLEFDNDFFTVKHLMDRLSKNPNCECCGKSLDLSFKKDKKFNDNSASMDRVDSAKGYIKGNVAIICWRCNKVKQNSTAKELRVVADFIDRFYSKQSQ
jgi:hypothetical protein